MVNSVICVICIAGNFSSVSLIEYYPEMSAEIPVVLASPYFVNEGFSRAALEPKLDKGQISGCLDRMPTDYSCSRDQAYLEQANYPSNDSRYGNFNLVVPNGYPHNNNNLCCDYSPVSQFSSGTSCNNNNGSSSGGIFLSDLATSAAPQPVRMMCSIYIDPGCSVDSLNAYNQGKFFFWLVNTPRLSAIYPTCISK